MNKKLIFILVLLASLLITIPVGAAWSERISGGASQLYYAGKILDFTVTLSAWENTDGTFGGQGQYYHEPSGNTFHLVVERICTGIRTASGAYYGQPYVVAIGPIKTQDGTVYIKDGQIIDYGGIVVAEGGDYGDGIRVPIGTVENMNAICLNGATTGLPARVVDGNFNIRSK